MEVFHNIVIHVTTDGYLQCFQFSAIVNDDVINILAHVVGADMRAFLLIVYLGVELLGHRI